MKQITFIIIALLAVLLSGCKKEIEFRGDEGKVYVVVMARLEPDSAAVISLAHSRFFLSNEAAVGIDDADLTLWVNGNPCQPTSVVGGHYSFPVSPAAGDSVWFQGILANGDTISSSTRMVSYPQLANTIVSRTTGFEFWRMMDLHYIQFDLTDNPLTKDHYKFEVIERDQRPAYEEDEPVDTTFFAYTLYLGDKEVGDTAMQDIFSAQMASAFTISDSLINGLTRSICMMAMPIVDTMGLTQYDFWVRVTTYSPEIQRYRQSAAMASSNISMFAEPMQVYSNIKGNAIGIFGSQSSRIQKCTLVADPNANPKKHLKKR